MKIWQLLFEVDEFDNLEPIEDFSAEYLQSFDGSSKKNNWIPMAVKRMEPEKRLELGDAPGFIIPTFSIRALEILRPLIRNSVEELELVYDEAEYWGINVIDVLDVIDYDKSKYRMFSDGKRIMAFQKYVFKESEELGNHHIFKIIDEPRRRAFVSDDFKKLVETNNLKGFKFKLAWDSEAK